MENALIYVKKIRFQIMGHGSFLTREEHVDFTLSGTQKNARQTFSY